MKHNTKQYTEQHNEIQYVNNTQNNTMKQNTNTMKHNTKQYTEQHNETQY
jgi:hypothetical protein